MLKLSTRLAIAMVALVLVTTIALGVITYRNVIRLALPRSLDRLETHALLNATRLESALHNARVDLMALSTTGAVAEFGKAYAQGLVDPSANDVAATWRRRIAARLTAELSAKPQYAQMRVIGREDGGRELVRVDRSGTQGAIRVVPEAELAPKGERAYFTNAIGLSAREMYVSPVELQQVPSAADRAPFPVVRVAAPLLAGDGKAFAVGVIDVDLQPEFDRIRASMDGGRQIHVVNERGEYLLHPDVQRGFAVESAAPTRIQRAFPRFDEAMAQGRTSGLWTDQNGEQFAVGWASALLAGGPKITVVEASAYPTLNVGFAAVGNSTLIAGALAMLCAIIFALLLARSLSKPLVQMTRAVEGFSRGESIALSPGGGREIEVLSAAFTHMIAEVKQKSALLNNVITTIADPVLVANERGEIVIANPAAQRKFGVAAGTSVASSANSWFTQFYPDGQTPFPLEQSAMSQALRGNSVDNLHVVVRPLGAGSDMDIVASGRPIIDESGLLRGAVTVYHDITRNLKAQEAQSASEQMAQAIIDTALDAFVQIDSLGTVPAVESQG